MGGERRQAKEQGEVSLFDVRSGKEKRTFTGHTAIVYRVAFSPNGQALATAGGDGSLFVWEIASGRLRHRFVGHQSGIHGLAFSSDGALLAASSSDAPAYVWDVYGKHQPLQNLAAAELHQQWEELASDDAMRAFQAMRRLMRSPQPALALLRERLRPAQPVEEKRLPELLQDLESESFATRRRAYEELAKLGDQIEGYLRRSSEQSRPLEAKRRLEELLRELDVTSSARLRAVRALEVLEQIGGPEVLRLLDTLASGSSTARWTMDVAAVRDRMRKR